jgi:hypothetical protein
MKVCMHRRGEPFEALLRHVALMAELGGARVELGRGKAKSPTAPPEPVEAVRGGVEGLPPVKCDGVEVFGASSIGT